MRRYEILEQAEIKRRFFRLAFFRFHLGIILFFVLSFFLHSPSSYAYDLPLNDDIETCTVGAAFSSCSGWSQVTNTWTVSNDFSNSTSKSIRAVGNGTTDSNRSATGSNSLGTDSLLDYELYFRRNGSSTRTFSMYFGQSGGTRNCMLNVSSSTGAVRIGSNTSDFKEFGSVGSGTWHKLVLREDFANDACYGKVDNGLFSSAYTHAGTAGNNSFVWVVADAGTVDFYVDDFQVYDPSTLPVFTLSHTGSSLRVNQSVQFLAEWSNIPFTPYYLYFYEDSEETIYDRIVNNYPMSSSSDWTFYHSFAYEGSYQTFVQLGNQHCSTPTASGCVLYDVDDTEQVSILAEETDADILASYTTSLEFAKRNDILVDQPIYYSYTIDPDLCQSPSTITGRRLFKGYTPGSPQALADSGAVLTVNTFDGYLSWSQTNQPYSDFVFPYIQVYCSDSSYARLYVGTGGLSAIDLNGELVGTPIGLSVYTGDELRFVIPDQFLGGGASDNLGDDGTYEFRSEKLLYKVNEPVKFKWRFFPPDWFTVSEVRLHPDYDQLSYYYPYTSTNDLAEGSSHYGQVEYQEPGEYRPSVILISSSGATIEFFLGGTEIQSQGETLEVQSFAFGNVFGSCADAGIFGISDAFQFDIGQEGASTAYIVLGYALNEVFSTFVWLSSKAFCVVMQAPVLVNIKDLINPVAGEQLILPSSALGVDFDMTPVPVNERLFVIQYADEDGQSQDIIRGVITFVFMMFIISYLMKMIF